MASNYGMKSGGGQRGDIVPSGYKTGQLQNYTPQQMEIFGQEFSRVGPESYTARLAGGDQSLFNEIEAPAFQQFQEGLGGMASRFSQGGGSGSLGTRRSSGFQNAGTAAFSNFAQQLQSQRQALQRQALKDLHGMSIDLLDQRPYERQFIQKKEKKKTPWGSIAGGIVGGIGGAFVGNPMAGAYAGSAAGGALFD